MDFQKLPSLKLTVRLWKQAIPKGKDHLNQPFILGENVSFRGEIFVFPGVFFVGFVRFRDARRVRLEVLAFSPLAMGRLSGRYVLETQVVGQHG